MGASSGTSTLALPATLLDDDDDDEEDDDDNIPVASPASCSTSDAPLAGAVVSAWVRRRRAAFSTIWMETASSASSSQ